MTYEPRRRWWSVYEEAFDLVRVRGRRVAAVSGEIAARIAPTGAYRIVPNGIDPGAAGRTSRTRRLGSTRSPGRD